MLWLHPEIRGCIKELSVLNSQHTTDKDKKPGSYLKMSHNFRVFVFPEKNPSGFFLLSGYSLGTSCFFLFFVDRRDLPYTEYLKKQSAEILRIVRYFSEPLKTLKPTKYSILLFSISIALVVQEVRDILRLKTN